MNQAQRYESQMQKLEDWSKVNTSINQLEWENERLRDEVSATRLVGYICAPVFGIAGLLVGVFVV